MRRSGVRRRLRASIFLGVGLALTGIALLAYGTNVFKQLELNTVDTRFSVRGSQGTPKDLAVVQIDATTFSDFNNQGRQNIRYPFPRSLFAGVIDRLCKGGAKVIAYDIQFTEQTTIAEDNRLIDSVSKCSKVVLATTEVDAKGHSDVFGGDDVVRQVHARVGNGNFPQDSGGIIRRVAYKVDKLKSFSLVTAERETGKTITPDGFGHRKFNWIDFVGPPGTIRHVSFSRVLAGKFRPGTFQDKIVIVGPSAPSLQDVHSTSVGDGMSGAEVQANAVETALHGFPLRSVPGWLNILLIVVLGLLTPLVGARYSLRWMLGAGLAATAGFLVTTQLLFNHGWVVSFVYPFGALVLSTVGSIGAYYLFAAFERERVRDVFSRFVPEAVVNDVLARTDSDLRLGGVTMESTVMFTDLRGFTSFSESQPPSEVIRAINVYLSEMTEAIHEQGGTLVSYEGDGIMAVFGAPIEQADHADRAVESSRKMLCERLPRFNEWLQGQGHEHSFRMGIGLNTGPVVSGNVGSEQRMEYTALGDTTNTAARLQGMTKGTRHQLFLSDTTREALQSEVADLLYVDEFEVRGREAKVKIWSIVAATDEPPQVAAAASLSSRRT
jgi:adenylate cyclase